MKLFKKIMLSMLVAGSVGSVAFGMKNADEAKSKPNLEFCGICTDELNPSVLNPEDDNYTIKTPCGHSFHKHCLNDSLSYKSRCPLCRKDLTSMLTEEHRAAQIRYEAESRAEQIRSDLEAIRQMVGRGGEVPVAAPFEPGLDEAMHMDRVDRVRELVDQWPMLQGDGRPFRDEAAVRRDAQAYLTALYLDDARSEAAQIRRFMTGH